MERVMFTRVGYDSLMSKLEQMQGPARREVAAELEEARSHGDLRENADYDAAKEKQGMLEANIRLIEDQLARALVVENEQIDTETVSFGTVVELQNIETDNIYKYQIVGELESDLEKGKISVTAPIIAAVMGCEVGDIEDVQTPQGVQSLEVISITLPSRD